MNFKKILKTPTQIAIFDFSSFNAGKLEFNYIPAVACGNKAVIAADGREINLKQHWKAWNSLTKVYPSLEENSMAIVIADRWVDLSAPLNTYWKINADLTQSK